MTNLLKNQIIIDGLEYCNWNREILEDLWKGGITAIHATLVYWENTEESFNKIIEFEKLISNNEDIICHAKTSQDIIDAKKDNKVAFIFGFQNSNSASQKLFSVSQG